MVINIMISYYLYYFVVYIIYDKNKFFFYRLIDECIVFSGVKLIGKNFGCNVFLWIWVSRGIDIC